MHASDIISICLKRCTLHEHTYQALFFKEFYRKKHGRPTTGRISNTGDEGIDVITRLFGQVMPKEIPESTEWRAHALLGASTHGSSAHAPYIGL